MLTNHHIVLDGWSLPILLQEIFAGYRGDNGCPRPPRSRGFINWLADQDLPAAHAAWRGVLEGLRHPDPRRPVAEIEAGAAGGAWRIEVPAETTRALNELARSHRNHRQHRLAGRLGASC